MPLIVQPTYARVLRISTTDHQGAARTRYINALFDTEQQFNVYGGHSFNPMKACVSGFVTRTYPQEAIADGISITGADINFHPPANTGYVDARTRMSFTDQPTYETVVSVKTTARGVDVSYKVSILFDTQSDARECEEDHFDELRDPLLRIIRTTHPSVEMADTGSEDISISDGVPDIGEALDVRHHVYA